MSGGMYEMNGKKLYGDGREVDPARTERKGDRADEIADGLIAKLEMAANFGDVRNDIRAALRDYAKEERERCAKIAESFAVGYSSGIDTACAKIAARIREGDTKA